MFEFELEKGSKKFACPNCNAPTKFKRYVRRATGEYAPLEFGRCDRESNCGYHRYPSKEYFADNPQTQNGKTDKNGHYKKGGNTGISNYVLTDKNAVAVKYEAETLPKKPDYISNDVLLRTLTGFDRNAFVQFLLNLFPEDTKTVWQTVKDYFIGTSKDGKTIFWQIDQSRRIRTGKMIAYESETGKRRKDVSPNWTHAALKRARLLKQDFNLMQCFFGEHLLRFDSQKPVAIVEAEKTAVIASICFPEFVWLAIGSKQSLKCDRLKRLSKRKIVLYPDADGFALWQEIAFEARQNALTVKVSNLIERCGTDAEKGKGFDLADYLISQQSEINRTNDFVDFYNAKLAHVLIDENLMRDFQTILDEQLAVRMIDGNLLDADADAQITEPDNFRRIVLSL